MEQKKICEILEDFKNKTDIPVLINLCRITKALGIEKIYEQDCDRLLKILKNHVWSCIRPGCPPYFVDLEGFKLLHKIALEYEKSMEGYLNYKKKLTEEFLKKYGIKEGLVL